METSTRGLTRGDVPTQYGVRLCCFPRPGGGTYWLLFDEKNFYGGAPGGWPAI
jgi:hypothetical protein